MKLVRRMAFPKKMFAVREAAITTHLSRPKENELLKAGIDFLISIMNIPSVARVRRYPLRFEIIRTGTGEHRHFIAHRGHQL